jgi:hypothetical protein
MFPIAIVQILASVAIEDKEVAVDVEEVTALELDTSEDDEVAVGVEEVTVLEFDTSEEIDG